MRIAPEVLAAVAAAQAAADAIATEKPTYGRSTGVGANRQTTVTETSDHGIRLMRSHATDAGDALPQRVVRALVATRLAQLAQPGSGISPAILSALETALDHDEIAEIGAVGSIGTADLAALAALGLTLAGERAGATPAPPVQWGVDSALPFLSSSALTIGRAILASDELRRLDRAGRIAFALAAVALRSNPSARVRRCRLRSRLAARAGGRRRGPATARRCVLDPDAHPGPLRTPRLPDHAGRPRDRPSSGSTPSCSAC